MERVVEAASSDSLNRETGDMVAEKARPDLVNYLLLSSRLLRYRWLMHTLFWGLYVTFFALTGGDTFGVALQYELLLLPVKMLVVYTTIYVLIPRFFLTGNYWVFMGFALLILIMGGLLQRVVIYYVLYPLMYAAELPGNLITIYWIVKHSLSIFTVTILASSIKITRYWYEDHQKAKALREEKLEAELTFLKAQIHPHFFFNTLNNLYSLALQQSPSAPEVVLRLSGLVHYILYETSSATVTLEREIESIHNYIALERIRYGDSLDIFFDVKGPVEGVSIAPMLLLPFVENSFKQVDLLFLDIQMPRLTGIELLRNMSHPPGVIFTTAFRDYALAGYELDVIDYLLKPISFERFLRAVNKFYQTNMPVSATHPMSNEGKNLSYQESFIYLKADKKMVKILLKDILYIQSLKDYVRVKTIGKSVTAYQKISFMEEKLPEDRFIRVYRSYIVARDKVEAFSNRSVELGEMELPIGRNYRNEVLNTLNQKNLLND